MNKNAQGTNLIFFSLSTVTYLYVNRPAESKSTARIKVAVLIFSNLKKTARNDDFQKSNGFKPILVYGR